MTPNSVASKMKPAVPPPARQRGVPRPPHPWTPPCRPPSKTWPVCAPISPASPPPLTRPIPAKKIALLNDLSQAAQGTNRTTTASIKQLAGDLLKALAGKKKLAAAQQTRLAREIHVLFNSARLSSAQQQNVLTDIQKILTDADVSLDNTVDVLTDLKAVVAQTIHAAG